MIYKNCPAVDYCGLCHNWQTPRHLQGKCRLSFDTSIDDIYLTVRETRICKENNIKTVHDLWRDHKKLESAKGCGVKTFESLEMCAEALRLVLWIDQEGDEL